MYKQLLSLLLLMMAINSIAQQPKIKPITNKKLPPINTDAIGVVVTDIQLFERPDYQGKSGYFKKMNDGTYKAPFPLNDCSFRVPQGKIVYIKTIFEFASETAYARSEDKISLNNVIGIRSDDKVGVIISFDAISTSIHNGDCRKLYGNIKIALQESAPDADSTMSTMMRAPVPGSGRRLVLTSTERWTFVPWKYADPGSVPGTQRAPFNQYVIDNAYAPTTPPPHPEWNDRSRPDPYVAYFTCGKRAIQEGRVKFHFTTDLATAHKTCGICDDFSSRVKMSTPAYQFLPLRNYYGAGELDTTTVNHFVLGPYEAKGSRDGVAITATGGPTVKQFRVYYSMKLHQP
ncbi:MAG TPA: hypothetical protein VHM26_05570 [Chitinophagaceae bacterium]|jgi:hypothetical protein|nr:hypothetical protein [Chitinophagaceae bacterium]